MKRRTFLTAIGFAGAAVSVGLSNVSKIGSENPLIDQEIPQGYVPMMSVEDFERYRRNNTPLKDYIFYIQGFDHLYSLAKFDGKHWMDVNVISEYQMDSEKYDTEGQVALVGGDLIYIFRNGSWVYLPIKICCDGIPSKTGEGYVSALPTLVQL